MTDDSIERAFEIYIKERFPSYAAFDQACQDKNTFVIDWLVALPLDRRTLALAKAAKACKVGPCSLIRFSAGKNCDIETGTYIVAQHLVEDMLTAPRVKDGRVLAEILAVYQGTG